MKLRDLPLSLAKAFGNSSLWLERFVAPKENPHLDILFVTGEGKPTHINDSAQIVCFDEPLSGLFYDREFSGLSFVNPQNGWRLKNRRFVAVSESTDGVIYTSALFEVNVPIRKLKDYARENRIKWYLHDSTKWVSFDDYSDYISAARQLVGKNSVT